MVPWMSVMRGVMISRTVRRAFSLGLKTLEVMRVMTMKMQKKLILQKKGRILMRMERARVKQKVMSLPP